jgi:hypothetical protein
MTKCYGIKQMTTKYVYQTVIKYIKISHFKAYEIIPKCVFVTKIYHTTLVRVSFINIFRHFVPSHLTKFQPETSSIQEKNLVPIDLGKICYRKIAVGNPALWPIYTLIQFFFMSGTTRHDPARHHLISHVVWQN